MVQFLRGASFFFYAFILLLGAGRTFAMTNANYDEKYPAVVKLVTKDKSGMCSGTIVGVEPVTVLTALHCLFLLERGLYVDRSEPYWKVKEFQDSIAKAFPLGAGQGSFLLPGLNANTSETTPQMGNLKINPDAIQNLNLANLNNLNLSNANLNLTPTPKENPYKPAPFDPNWEITKAIIPASMRNLPELKEYLSLREDEQTLLDEIKSKLLSMPKNPQNTGALIPSLEIASVEGASLLGMKLPKTKEQLERESILASIKKINFDLIYVRERSSELREKLVGYFDDKRGPQDAILLVVKNAKFDESLDALVKSHKVIPVLDQAPAKLQEEVLLLGYGMTGLSDSESNANNADFLIKADRKITANIPNYNYGEEVPEGYFKVVGLKDDANTKHYPLGKMGTFLQGDSGGPMLYKDSIVAVNAQLKYPRFVKGEPYSEWPDFSSKYNNSKAVIGYSVRTDTPSMKKYLEQAAQEEGADVIFRNSTTGELYR